MNQDPEWMNDAQVHNTLTILNMARFMSPIVMFGILYFVLSEFTDFNKSLVAGLSFMPALGDYLLLTWLVKIIKGKDSTIG